MHPTGRRRTTARPSPGRAPSRSRPDPRYRRARAPARSIETPSPVERIVVNAWSWTSSPTAAARPSLQAELVVGLARDLTHRPPLHRPQDHVPRTRSLTPMALRYAKEREHRQNPAVLIR